MDIFIKITTYSIAVMIALTVLSAVMVLLAKILADESPEVFDEEH